MLHPSSTIDTRKAKVRVLLVKILCACAAAIGLSVLLWLAWECVTDVSDRNSAAHATYNSFKTLSFAVQVDIEDSKCKPHEIKTLQSFLTLDRQRNDITIYRDSDFVKDAWGQDVQWIYEEHKDRDSATITILSNGPNQKFDHFKQDDIWFKIHISGNQVTIDRSPVPDDGRRCIFR